MSLKLIIFDLDGTLLNTLQDLADATNEALAEFGLPPLPAEDYKLLVGMGARVLMQRSADRAMAISAKAGRPIDLMPESDKMVDAFNRAYEPRWAGKTQPYPGIPELLADLSGSGIQMAILSNKPNAFTQKVAARYFPDGLFRTVFGMRLDIPGKPDPALTLEMCHLLGVLPEETAMVGDSGSDMKTAVAAGSLPVGVLWGFRSSEELSTNGARYLVKTPTELVALLKSLI